VTSPAGNRLTVLVTAAGSELAFNVIKALRVSSRPISIATCDVSPNSLGRYWSDVFERVPPAAAGQDYVNAVMDMVRRHRIDAVIPTADAEFPVLAQHRDEFRSACACAVLVSPPEQLHNFTDKWKTAGILERLAIPAPRTALYQGEAEALEFAARVSYPLVLKPRIGGGSRMIHFPENDEELRAAVRVVAAPLLQEYLHPDDEEYTAGVFTTRHGEMHVIVLRRTLKFGMTYVAETVFSDELDEFCRGVARSIGLQGANNIQFRVTAQGPKVIEINPRFSGTVGIRAQLGFNDVEMALCDALDLPSFPHPDIRSAKVYRFMDEHYVDLPDERTRG
jgi:carbamoyl-phosphate synthase large subunit